MTRFNQLLLLLTGILIYNTAQCQVISTYAGNGLDGYGNSGIPTYSGDGGLAIMAQLNPFCLGKDSKGNIYVSQASAFYTVRKIDKTTGIITTVAGNGTRGYSGDGGHATAAQLNEPRGIAFDSKDNLYIADYWNNCIRRVDASTGIITTIAGNGNVLNNYTGNGGPAKDALLFEPFNIAFDKSDNLYFSDFNNNCIRRIDAQTGIITKVAGNDPPGFPGYSGDGGLAENSTLYGPMSIVINDNGDIYFSDFINNRIRKIASQTRIISTIAGNGGAGATGDGGLAINAEIYAPRDLSLDAEGNLFICAGTNNLSSPYVRKIDLATGIISRVAGNGQAAFSGDGGHPLAAGMLPSATIFDDAGNLYIADTWNSRVRKVIPPSLLPPSINYKGDECFNSTILFELQANYGITKATWDFGDSLSDVANTSAALNPTHHFSSPGNYTVTVSVTSGTKTVSTSTVISIKDCQNPSNGPSSDLMIPKAFSPNGDGVNDHFKTFTSGEIQLYEMNIYNRYGQIVFSSSNISSFWDGNFKKKLCPTGAYVYLVKYRLKGALTKQKRGAILLMR